MANDLTIGPRAAGGGGTGGGGTGGGTPPAVVPRVRPVTIQTFFGWMGVDPDGTVRTSRPATGADRLTLTDLNGGELQDGDLVAIQAPNGLYFCADQGGGASVVAARHTAQDWERFRVTLRPDGSINLRAANGQFLVAEGNGILMANRQAAAAWEEFRLRFEQ